MSMCASVNNFPAVKIYSVVICPCMVSNIRTILLEFNISDMFFSPCVESSACFANITPCAVATVDFINDIDLAFCWWSVFGGRE